LPNFIDSSKIINDLKDLKPADIILVAVSDDAISEVTSQIPVKNQLVAHISGSSPLEVINGTHRRGVFYMLQTFSKGKQVDFSQVPFCLEADNESDFATLEQLALLFSEKVYKINTEQRKSLHTAAVFVSNFVNHMYVLGEEICKENKVPFEILKPLIIETAHKLEFLSPKKAQTGPAIRNDKQTIDRQIESLTDENKKLIYKTITNSIKKK